MTGIKRSKGFTLIELIVVIIIMGVVGVFTFQFLASGIQTYITMQRQKELLDEARLCLERMSREIRDAEQILTFTSNTSIQFEKSHGTAYDPAKTIVFRYRPAFDDIRRQRIPPGSWDLLAENITAFTMTTNTSNEILIRTILSTAGGESLTMETRCFPRNLVSPPIDHKSFYRSGQGNWREKIT
jgi:prepilin-type N-terminal cleavage/methylation domain-containing protein